MEAMKTIQDVSFSVLVTALVFLPVLFVDKPEESFIYSYEPLSGECEKVGSIGNHCFQITRTLTTPHQ